MAKPIRCFYGSDSYGRSVETVQSVTGKWFSRHTERGPYGNQMTKWYESEDQDPTFETHGTNVYSGETFEYEIPVLFWGFHKMHEISGKPPRYRLPS